jgi:hypothetical protein
MSEKEYIRHHWKSQFLSYFEDLTKSPTEIYEDVRKQADMACMLIPRFLKDLGFKMLEINRVDYYNYDIDWKAFESYIAKEHPYLKIFIWNQKESS